MKNIVFSFQYSVFSVIALMAICSTAFASGESLRDAATISVVATTDKIQVAEPFTLDLKITAPSGTRVMLPAVGKQLGDFDVIDHQDVSDIPSSENANDRTWTRRMTLESIVTGDLEIPAMEFQVASGGEAEVIKSNPISVHVISVLEGQADPAQLRDIHSVVDINVPQPESNSWLWWLAGGGSLIALAAASVFVVAKRKTWMTPSQWALNELDELSRSNAAEFGESETVSQQLSTILRDYLELQFEISAPLQATQELLSNIESSKLLDSEIAKRFAEIFESADLAKFAGVQMSPTEMGSAIDESRQLIEETSGFTVAEGAKTSGESTDSSRTLASPATTRIRGTN